MARTDGSADSIARNARHVADRIEAFPDAMVQFLDADPKPSLALLREALSPTEIAVECLDIFHFIARHWTPVHAETFSRRIDNVVDGASAFLDALAYLTAPQSGMSFDRMEFAKFGVVALMTAQYVRRWAEDIGRKGRPKTPRQSKSGKKARRRARSKKRAPSVLTKKQQDAWLAYGRLGSYTKVAGELGISRQAATDLVRKAEAIVETVSRSAPARQRIPTDKRGQDIVPADR